MSSAPMYVLMTEEDFEKAMSNGESIEDIGPYEDDLVNSRDFSHYAGYVSSIDNHETRELRAEAALDIARYLNLGDNNVATVNADGILCLAPDAGLEYAKGKIAKIQHILETMTPEEYANSGENTVRNAVRNQMIFAYPVNYSSDTTMRVGEYMQPMDAFIHNLYYDVAGVNQKVYRFVVIQTVWLHS